MTDSGNQRTPAGTFDELVRKRFGEAIEEYARGNAQMEQHAIDSCYPAIAALELDEAYATLVMTARMDNLLAGLIEHGAGRQGNAEELLFDVYKPMSSFSAKINVTFFLGFITERMYRAINCCRNIRNAYAHNETPERARSDRKYQSNKTKLIELDPLYTRECVRKLSELERNTGLNDTVIAANQITAIMMEICDSLSHALMYARVYSKQMKPDVVPAIFGFEMDD